MANDLVTLLNGLEHLMFEMGAELRPRFSTALVAVVRVYEQLHFNSEEALELFPGLVSEIARRLPDTFADAALVSALPHLAERFRRHYARNPRVSRSDAEDFSHNAIVKILNAVRGSGPRGNVGAWVAAVRDNVLRDYWRWLERRDAKCCR